MILIPVYEEYSPFENFACSCRRRQQMRELETQRRILRHLVDDPLQFFRHLDSPLVRDTECKKKSSQEKQKTSEVDQEQARKNSEPKTDEAQRRILSELEDNPLQFLWHHLVSPLMRDTESKEKPSQRKQKTSEVGQEQARKKSESKTDETQRINFEDNPLQFLWHHLDSTLMRETECKEKSSQEKQKTSDVVQEQARKNSEPKTDETQRRIISELEDNPLQFLWQHLVSPLMRDVEKSSEENKESSQVDQEKVSKVSHVAKEVSKTRDVAVKNSFNIQLKTADFQPDEITVKVKDGEISIHAKHEEKDSGNFVFREMQRNFTIPSDVNPETIIAEMNKDGLLIIKAETSNPPQEIKSSVETITSEEADVRTQAEDDVVTEKSIGSAQTEENNVVIEKTVIEASTSTENETPVGA